MPTNPWTVTQSTQDPYLAGYDQAAGAQQAQTPQIQQNLASLQSQMQGLGGQSAPLPPMGQAPQQAPAYPAYPNPYGLGASMDNHTATQGTASNPDYLSRPISVTVPDSASRGFNPWSLTGESNARGQ